MARDLSVLKCLPQQQKRSLGCSCEVLFELVSCLVPANFISYQSCLYAPVFACGNKVRPDCFFFCFFFLSAGLQKKKQLDGGRVSSLCSSSNGSLSRSMLKSNFTAEINMLPASRWLQSFIQTMVSDGNRPQELLVLVCSRMKGWIQVRLRLVALTLFCFFFYSLNTQTCEIMSFIFAHG